VTRRAPARPAAWHATATGKLRLESDRDAVEREFPSLTFQLDAEGNVALEGDVTVQIGERHEIFRTARVGVRFPPDYPARGPLATVAPGTFIAHAGRTFSDRHIDEHGVCCLELGSSWDSGDPNALVSWLRNFVLFIHRQFIYDRNGGVWPGPEWKHGADGWAQFVEESLEQFGLVPKFVANIMGPSTGRRAPCPCGSGRPFAQCHKTTVSGVIRSVPDRERWAVARKLAKRAVG
jgi:hypothetical protein